MAGAKSVLEYLDKIVAGSGTIAVVGDAMTDVYIGGRLEPCQDGCQKFVEESRVTCPGGVANAVNSITQFTKDVYCAWDSGAEERTVKTRFLVGGKIVWRHDAEGSDERERLYTHRMCLDALQGIPIRGVYISDYDKGFLTHEFMRKIVLIAREKGVPVVADCKREPGFYEGCVLKCNKDYHDKFGDYIQHTDLVLTIGSTPPTVWDGGIVQPAGVMLRMRGVKCVNHVGAGDCFGAHMLLALSRGAPLSVAATIAHSAGRVYVQHPNNRPPKIEEIRADLEQC